MLIYTLFGPVLKHNLFTRHGNYYEKNLHLFSHSSRMSKNNINFDDKKVNKTNFLKNKRLFKVDDIVVNRILVSKKEPYGKKKLI